MTYRIEIIKAAARQLEVLPESTGKRIDTKIRALAANPRPPGAKTLQGREGVHLRIRVGDYRVVYHIDDRALLVLVVRIGHRREVYR